MKKRQKYSLSYDRLFSCKGGFLIPCGLTEVVPGDTIQHHMSAFIRMSPLVAPIMHPLHVKVHHWFVPFRLLWDEWEDFITGGPDGLNISEFPTIDPGTPATGSLLDYLGIPTESAIDTPISALPVRAYNLIYNEWYRWPQLQDALALSLASGTDTTTSKQLLRADWDKDYFTTATPEPQLGAAVTIPVQMNADGLPLTGSGIVLGSGAGAPVFGNPTSGPNDQFDVRYNNSSPGFGPLMATLATGGTTSVPIWFAANKPVGKLDLSTVSIDPAGDLGTININDFREAMALQRFAEHRNLYGSRYVEFLRYYGIRSSDARLQRPEFLGGGRQTMQFSEVLQTAEGDDPVGALKGHGIGAMRSRRYRRFFEEHGYIVSLMQIVPKGIYAQGIDRTWLKQVKEDFYHKELEHIGEQEVMNAEIYAFGSNPRDTFGYQARYQEYRAQTSNIAGEFRNLLDYWHMARIFTEQPVLNADFLDAHPTERIFAEQTQDQYYVMSHHSMQARRMVTALQSAQF